MINSDIDLFHGVNFPAEDQVPAPDEHTRERKKDPITGYGAKLTSTTIQRTILQQRVNDELIDIGILLLLQEEAARRNIGRDSMFDLIPHLAIFTTMQFQLVRNRFGDEAGDRRPTLAVYSALSRQKFLTRSKWLMPFATPGHFVLAVVEPQERKVWIYDSLASHTSFGMYGRVRRQLVFSEVCSRLTGRRQSGAEARASRCGGKSDRRRKVVGAGRQPVGRATTHHRPYTARQHQLRRVGVGADVGSNSWEAADGPPRG